jgi:hypothetical protein
MGLVTFCNTRVPDGTSQAQGPEIKMAKDESETSTHTTQEIGRLLCNQRESNENSIEPIFQICS